MGGKKSQSSLEFLMIFGIGFLLVTALSGIFFTYSMGAKKQLDRQQIENIGDDIISNAEKVYYLGEGNRLTMKTKFPEGIKNLSIHHIENKTNEYGENVSYDYLNITYFQKRKIISSIFTPSDLDVRLNCSGNRCNHVPSRNLSYYNSSVASSGLKEIRIESKGMK